MTDVTLDRLLAVLLVLVIGTGPLTWRAGSPGDGWVYIVHGALSGVLLVVTLVKLWRSLPRAVASGRWRRLLIAVPLAMLTLLSLATAFAWVAGGTFVQLGPWTRLGWHGIFGLLIAAVVVVHLLPHRWRLLRPNRRWFVRPSASALTPDRYRRRISRRAVLVAGTMGTVGVAVWASAGVLDLLGGRPRRFTGSRFLPTGSLPIPTTFLVDQIPSVDPLTWRLRVSGLVEEAVDLTLDELLSMGLATSRRSLTAPAGGRQRTPGAVSPWMRSWLWSVHL